MAMTIVVTYDVRQDRRRSHLSAYLQRFGDRVSVYICLLEQERLEELITKARSIVDLATDSVYVLAQCAACWEHVITIGQAHPPEQELYWAAL